MLAEFYNRLAVDSPVAPVVIAIGLMLFCGFFVTRLTKLLRLPNVTAYILTGIALGPCCLNLVPRNVAVGMEFVPDIALAFIAFAAGEFFRLPTLRRNWRGLVAITVMEALGAAAAVFAVAYWLLHLGLPFSILLAAMSSATAPASTLMTIRQTGAKGDFVNTLLSVVALDDVVSLLAFAVAVAVSLGVSGGVFSLRAVLLPLLYNLLMIIVGCALGFVLKLLMSGRSTDNRLIVTLALLFGLCGLGAAIGVSPLLGCMFLGMTYINLTDDSRLFKQINYFSPPILLLFFVRSGLTFRLDALLNMRCAIAGVPLLAIGVIYFLVRIAGKYGGAWCGCALIGKSSRIRDFLGLALIPQAGVAIGLAALGARLLGGETGEMLQTIILSSSILYELIGPACAKAALYLSGSYGPIAEQLDGLQGDAEPEAEANPIDDLRRRLLDIQDELHRQEYARSDDELAFAQAAEQENDEDNDIIGYMTHYRNRNPRFRR